jgi:hypothetical protein
MPIFKTTYNILKKYDEDELFEENWMDSNKLFLPKKNNWDYSRELTIEDVDVWEVIYESSNGIGVYASWNPYAEFYMITTGLNLNNPIRYIKEIPYYDRIIETYYGIDAFQNVKKRMIDLNIPVIENLVWVKEEDFIKISNASSKKNHYIA